MRRTIGKMDLWLLVIMVLFSAFGLVMIYSSSSIAAVLRYKVNASYFFKKQAIVTIVSYLIGFLLIANIKTKKYYYALLPASIGIIAALILIFSYGKITNGAQSWFRVNIFAIQPAEFAKTIMIFCTSIMYNRIYCNKNSPKNAVLYPLGFSAILAVLIAIQPDFGSAAIVCGIAFLIYLSLPFGNNIKKKIYKYIGIGIVILAAVLLITGNTLLNNMQSSRLKNFLHPCSSENGYQVCNGFVAIHNGGLFGVGLGNSSQKFLYLPESHTDFIFPIICEELGLFAGVGVLILYAAMLYRIYKIAKGASNLRNSILAYGTFLLILSHVLINILGVLGLIPLTGVPLPFLSYGGSFTFNIIIMLFIVQRVAIENSEEKEKNKIKKI